MDSTSVMAMRQMISPSISTPRIRSISRPARLCILVSTLFWGISGTPSSLGTERSEKGLAVARVPLWQLDVRALGYLPLKRMPAEVRPWGLGISPISFRGEEDVIVTYLTREAPTSLTRRNEPQGSLPYCLHALFVDAKTGQLRARQEWATASHRSGVIAVPRSNFAVLTPDTLTVFSPDLRPFRKLDLFLSRRARDGDWAVRLSPDVKTMLIMHAERDDQYCFEWLDLDELRLLSSWTESGRENIWKGTEDIVIKGGQLGSVYDHEMASHLQTGFLIRELDGPWRFVRYKRPVSGSFRLVRPDVLLGLSSASEFGERKQRMSLVRTDGEVFFEQEFPEREGLSSRALSANGRRFAATLVKSKGGSAVLDIPARYILESVVVFDLISCRWLYKVDAKGQNLKSVSALALSPDGSLLALIDQDGILDVYGVPRTPGGLQSPQ